MDNSQHEKFIFSPRKWWRVESIIWFLALSFIETLIILEFTVENKKKIGYNDVL